jgi:hypothetical protein
MKFFIQLLSVAILFTACGNKKKNGNNQDLSVLAKIEADTANYTQIQWVDSVYNFGTIEEGAQIQVQFKFKNVGAKPLFLTSVKAGCGCTTPDYTKEAVAPGKEGWVNAIFNSQNQHLGEIQKFISVKSNTINCIGIESQKLVFTGVINKRADK